MLGLRRLFGVLFPEPLKKKPALTKNQLEISHLKSEISKLKSELETVRRKCDDSEKQVQHLKEQHFNYVDVRRKCEPQPSTTNSRQSSLFEFFAGLSLVAYDCLWNFLYPSDENIISPLQSTDPTSRAQGGGRHSLLSLQDQLSMALSRLHHLGL